jgi:hypothetical protein
MKSRNYLTIFVLTTTIILLNSCKKLIDVQSPQNQLTTDKVFADSISATSAMVNVYALFNNTIDPNYNSYLSCYSDELSYTGSTQQIIEYFQSAVPPPNTADLSFWQTSYFAIYSCNDFMTQVVKSSNLSPATLNEFTNEAKFLRAFAYFYLINTYGSVPLVLQTNVNVNSVLVKSDSAEVYKQIVQDLKDAHNGLSANYIGAGKVRANKYAASAMLAKVYLWQRDWADAEAAATSVIESGLYTPLPTTVNTFLANSQESILSFWTQYGYIADGPNLIPSSGPPQYFYTSAQLNAFEAGDLRKSDWTLASIVGSNTFYSPYKYHNLSANTTSPEYLIALRAGEQYLIRAESRVQQNNIVGALADLNVIRTRAGLGNYAGAMNKASVLIAILHERQVELFTEWGNRFLDLKRTGSLNVVVGSLKPSFKPNAIALPIPQSEINTDPNLKQNQGY